MITNLIKALVVLEPYLENVEYPIHCEKTCYTSMLTQTF